MYPSKIAADSHTSYCTVSRTIADLLKRSPELVSVALNTFCLPAAAGSNKNYIAAMQKFGEIKLTDFIRILAAPIFSQLAEVAQLTTIITKFCLINSYYSNIRMRIS